MSMLTTPLRQNFRKPLTTILGDVGAAVVADVVADFGALTKAGAGGVPVTGTSITSGDPSGHWQISGGYLSPSSAGDTANLSAGTYSLELDNGQTAAITVLANAYHVRPSADETSASGELRAITNAGTPALGQTIWLRDGIFNVAQADWRIENPLDLTAGWDENTWVTIKAENDYQAVIKRIGISTNTCYSFEKIKFDCDVGGAGTGSIYSTAAVGYTRIKDCQVKGTPNALRTDSTDLAEGLTFTHGTSRIFVLDNDISDCKNAIRIKGTDSRIQGNLIRRAWGDEIQVSSVCARLQIIGNDMSDKRSTSRRWTITNVVEGNPTVVTVSETLTGTGIGVNNDAVFVGMTGLDEQEGRGYNISAINEGTKEITIDVDTSASTPWVSGGQLWETGTHPDHIQFSLGDGSLTTADLTDVIIRGNKISLGDVTPYLASGQGIFISDSPVGANMKNIIIEGNYVECDGGNHLTVRNPEDAVVRYNTFVSRLMPAEAATNSPTMAWGGTPAGTNYMYGNVIPDGSAGPTITADPNTVFVDNYGVTPFDAIAYAAAFFDPPSNYETTDPEIDYAPKAGGPIALLSPVPGPDGHQDFNAPYTFTAPTPNHAAPAVPDAFSAGNWSVSDAEIGGRLDVAISSLPQNNFATITDVQYRLDGGTWTSSGGIVGFSITGLTDGVEGDLELRAVNAQGNSATSDLKSATPSLVLYIDSLTAAAASSTTIDVDVTVSPTGHDVYVVATESATTPTAAQIVAGQDHLGASAEASASALASDGTESFTLTVTTNKTYYIHAAHVEGAVSVVSTSSAVSVINYATRDNTQSVHYNGPTLPTGLAAMTVELKLRVPDQTGNSTSDEGLWSSHGNTFNFSMDPRNTQRRFYFKTTDSTNGNLVSTQSALSQWADDEDLTLVISAHQNVAGNREMRVHKNGTQIIASTTPASGAGTFYQTGAFVQHLLSSSVGAAQTFPLGLYSMKVWHGAYVPDGDVSGLGTPTYEGSGGAAFWNGATPISGWTKTGAGVWS